MSMNEQDLRLRLLNTLLATPHRDLDSVYPVHREILEQDPRFYVQMAAWYADEGEVRDHKEMFVVNLCLSDFPGHRDVGLALLREMPPYQVGRVFDFVKGATLRRRVNQDGQTRIITERRGLFRNVPRSMKTEITRYLREREANAAWFDSTVLQARRATKRLYASLHIEPSERAQAILFDDDPLADSRLHALKAIARTRAPAEQARAIVEQQIPYRVAASVVHQMTPTVLVALIDRMSPQEVINNMGSLKRHGALDNREVKALIEAKLEQAQTDGRVSAYKAKVAAEAAGVPADVAAKLDAVTEARVQAKGAIVRSTALLIDKSGSMSQAIEIGKRLGAMIAGICEAELYAYAFDSMPYEIEVPVKPGAIERLRGKLSGAPAAEDRAVTLADWERALAGIKAGGTTSCGVAVEMMRRNGQVVEQIIMVTDEGENESPRFVDALQHYRKELGADPHVVFVKTQGAANRLEGDCRRADIAYDAYDFAGDYYALPNLLPLLTRPSKLDLLLDIMAYPLPRRKPG
ncbi:MAG: hypothetical protein JXA93_03510 [Anaerolineae bacterium]|nr:hypothetical protein [Anaerolineae bacterium]